MHFYSQKPDNTVF